VAVGGASVQAYALQGSIPQASAIRVRRVVGEHLRGADRDPRPDREPSVELLLREHRDHARVPEQRLRPVGVQRLDHLGDGRDHGQARHVGPSGLHGREHLPGDVERARRPDGDEARLAGHTNAGERCERYADPARQFLVGEDEDAGHARGAGGREDPVVVQVGGAGIRLSEERLEVCEPEARIRHDPVELLHQQRLRQPG
jgi:hypothetical protein